MHRYFITAFTGILLSVQVYAQLSFQFLPELYGRNVDGLGTFQVQNMGSAKMAGRIYITVKDNTAGLPVVSVATPETVFAPGITSFPRSVFSNSAFTFSVNGYGAIAGQTRNIPPGEYSFCFRFVPVDKTAFDEYENCFDGEIQPLVPLTLMNPSHMDSICTRRPVLSWQPPLPFSAGMRFRLILTEKRTASGVEDLLTKAPLLLLDNISTSVINYPAVNPELKEGATYYWQVVAHEKGLIVSKSEIWEFTVQCTEPVKKGPADSYRELKVIANGNYYIANRNIRFTLRNDYNVQKLRYSILDVSKGSEAIKDVPEVNLQQGLNKINIELGGLDLKPGNHYILKVYPFNESPVEVRFVYMENDNIEMP